MVRHQTQPPSLRDRREQNHALHPRELLADADARSTTERKIRELRAISLTLGQIKDGMSQTVFVLEAGEAVEWTKPDDIDAGPGKPFPTLGGVRPKDDVIMVGFCDGSVRAVKKTVSEAQWRAGITHSGNDITNLD